MRHLTKPRSIAAGAIAATLLAAGAMPAAAAPQQDPEAGAPAPERVILNPTQDPSTSQTVTWRTAGVAGETPATAELRLPDGQVRTVEARTTKQMTVDDANVVTFSATFTELQPSTGYAYRVVSDGVAGDWNAFTTASASDEPFTFTWYADGQNDLTEKWTPIVGLANRAFPNSELTLQTGDLINHSVESEWEEWFAITDGQRQTENWLPAIGNHEYSRDADADFWDASFTVADNGPTADPDAPGSVKPYQELAAAHLANQVYFVDYQGVRFFTLNSNLRSQGSLEAELGTDLPDLPGSEFREIYLEVQTRWLRENLESSPANWNVVQFHHPTFSVSSGRNNPEWRAAFLPIFQEQDVDLVLSGHDHTYGRGFLDADATGTDGVTSGPVFAVSNSGPKYYSLAPDETNVWLANGATQVRKFEQTSFVQGIRVTPDTLEYEAIVAQKGTGSSTDLEIGETADSFTITRNDNGTTSVTDGIERRVATGLGELEVDPVEGDIEIEASVPQTAPDTGALTLTVDADSAVSMGEARDGGDRWSFSATLPKITVTDTRTEAAGWQLSGSAQDLVGAAGELSSAFLGWAPRVLAGATADSGPEVHGTLDGGEGLTGSHLLASADDHSRFGSTELVADLELDVPATTEAGDYAGAVDVVLFPVD